MTALTELSQSPTPGARVALYRLDASSVGGTVLYFCKGAFGDDPVVFDSIPYTPIDITVSDFEVNAGGALPTPKMMVSNTDMIIQGMINAFGDLNGCEIRRIRTFERFLDGQPDADPTCFIGPDVFRVERKSQENKHFVEWELSAAIDQEGKMLPGRQVLRDTCVKRYRTYNPSHPDAEVDGFVYSTVNPCPYTGAEAFTAQGEPTTAANDRCSRQLNSGCKLRFGENQPLPFGGFPGVARVRM
jgi:lambda family phage minor tail protein L